MRPDVGEAVCGTDRYGLLGHPTDLAGYRQALGPLPIPDVPDHAWQQGLVSALEASGLAGRGGAAFPSAVKLDAARADRAGGVIVVNGMEGEPASDKDKVLLTNVPHLVLDGAQLLGAVAGCSRIAVCVPAGRDAVAAAVTHAMAERAAGGYARTPEALVRPPDRFVAGEESALVQWMEDGRSLPSFRPDKAVRLRVGRHAALVHNAETLAHVALIARCGVPAFRAHGLPEEPGTSLVTISGAVACPGVVEVERGTPLRDIVARATPIRDLAAMLVGGYGGTWVGPHHFGTPYASLSLRTIGAAAGVGLIVALGAPACGIAETARVAHYAAGQSSGQCGPCVFGLPALADDLSRLSRGRADPEVMRRLERRLGQVHGRGACRHPDGAVALVRSALDVFAADVATHRRGEPCAHWSRPTQLRFPQPVDV
ncbi:MAG: NADH-ubiquinone oxidoreductase-F iron-sulfur binding region domain-containing protein [Acidimicrobiales bacterium]